MKNILLISFALLFVGGCSEDSNLVAGDSNPVTGDNDDGDTSSSTCNAGGCTATGCVADCPCGCGGVSGEAGCTCATSCACASTFCTAGGCTATECAADCACGCGGVSGAAGCTCATSCTCADESPPNCILDCEGFDQVDPDVDLNAFCEWVIDGGFTANDCNSDCDADALENLALATISCTECIADGSCGDGGDAESAPAVYIQAGVFFPATLTISVGETVTWTLINGFHSVESDDETWASPLASLQALTEPFSHTFDTAGEFGYHCGIHSSMTGIITVTE